MSSHPWLLGLLAGGTIFLGLPIARLRNVSTQMKAFLNAVSTGILIFLLVEIAGHLVEEIEELVELAVVSGTGGGSAFRLGLIFVIGFSLGLLGLVFFEKHFLGSAKDQEAAPAAKAKRLALMISVGLGLHNLSEGLAIGQGYSAGAIQLAWLLAIGFALHNATEGFGIAAPLSGHRVSWGFLGWCGLLAGGPTFLGALLGSTWQAKPAEIFCLALAAGTILYIIGELLHLGRVLKGEAIVEIGLLIGFFVAMASDFTISAAMEMTAAHGPRHGGYFGDADDLYHYELVRFSPKRIELYVNDHLNRPLDTRALQGRWILNPDQPRPLTGFFTPSADGAVFVGDLPEKAGAGSLHLQVEVLKGREWVGVEFLLPEQK
ncbi:MAG: ZIP family metal transporter [Candidatus Omnitrophica bacterium]|nr:ZIP family metal transporter [Candidatus Omnitrophota bacterium]